MSHLRPPGAAQYRTLSRLRLPLPCRTHPARTNQGPWLLYAPQSDQAGQGLLLCADDPGCSVTGLEIDPAAHAVAQQNIVRNGLSGRMESICTDLRSFTGSGFPVCISNPPYFSGGPASTRHPTARREDTCQPEELFEAAAKALRYGGDFFLVHKPERLAQLIGCGAKQGLEAKRLLLLHHKEGSDISLIFLSFRKGGKPGLIIEEESLFDRNGQPTDFYRSVYHL